MQRRITTIAQEKARNKHISGKTLEEFIDTMDKLDLPCPRKLDFAVPGNQKYGERPDNIQELYCKPCAQFNQGD